MKARLPRRRLGSLVRSMMCFGTLLLLPAWAPAQDAPAEAGKSKLTLEECIQLSMGQQPSLTAARASLAAAQASLDGLNRLRFASLLSPDLPLRKQQACLGVQIAAASLFQTECETRYAVTRNYYSIVYARMQGEVVHSVVGKLDRAYKQVEDFLKAGDPNIKVTAIDRDNVYIVREQYKSREAEAKLGEELALAALKEAIGVSQDYPLEIAGGKLPALVENLDKEALIAQALSLRGEMAQVTAADQVTELEIRAQSRIFGLKAMTFAAGSDLHAKPVPQGVANTEYRPWAIGLEFPPFMVGHKRDRVARSSDYKDRADAVVLKTEGLIALEVASAYTKWKQGSLTAKNLATTLSKADAVAKNVEDRFFDNAKATGKELLESRTQVNQVRANYNEALYLHALGLAAIERVTGGGFRIDPPAENPAPAPAPSKEP